MKGTVKWYNARKGYGFITPDDSSEDVVEAETHGYEGDFKVGDIVKVKIHTKFVRFRSKISYLGKED